MTGINTKLLGAACLAMRLLPRRIPIVKPPQA